MRRISIEEESAPRTTLPDAVQKQAEQQVLQEPVPAKEKQASSGKALRWTIMISGSIGIFALLTPVLTGVSLLEWLQSADFKAAYSSKNMAFIRGMGALKADKLAVATDALMELSPTSEEANDLGLVLFPKLIEAKDYERAARISGHLIQGNHGQANPGVLGAALGKERGLSEALEFLKQNPDAKRNRKLILPGVFAAVAHTELGALEKLARTLFGEEQISAAQAIVQAHMMAENFDDAWTWSAKLPAAARETHRTSMVTQESMVDPLKAIQRMKALKPTANLNSMRSNIVHRIMLDDLQTARIVAETITDPGLKKSAFDSLNWHVKQQKEWKKRIAKLDKLPTAEAKLNTLLSIMLSSGRNTFTATDILPRLMALAQKNPSVASKYDEVMRYLIVSTPDRKLRQKYLTSMRNPQTRAALIEELKSDQAVSAELTWDHGNGSAKTSGVVNMDFSAG